VQLSFTINESTSRLAYRLDRKTLIDTDGNLTLTGLSSGNHTITVFAWDTAGNIGTSKTTTFNINPPTPTPTATLAKNTEHL
jgi:hypothetical protein